MIQKLLDAIDVNNQAPLDWFAVFMGFTRVNSLVTKSVMGLWLNFTGTGLVLLLFLVLDGFLGNCGGDDAAGQVFTSETSLDVARAHVDNDEFLLVEGDLHLVQAFLYSAHFYCLI